ALIGERLQELDLRFGEGSRRIPRHHNDADRLTRSKHWHGQLAAELLDPRCDSARRSRVREIRDMDDSALDDGATIQARRVDWTWVVAKQYLAESKIPSGYELAV